MNWTQTDEGHELLLSKTKDPTDKIIVENPDSVGFCTITLQYRGVRTSYGQSFGSDEAKVRAGKIFRDWA